MTEALAAVPVEEFTTSQDDGAMSAAYDKMMAADEGQTRDESGRFSAPSSVDPATQEQQSPPLEGGKGAAVDATTTQQVEATSTAPAHLPQAIKDGWATMAEPARTALADLVKQQDTKFAELGRQIETYRPIADHLNEVIRQVPEFAGLTPERMAQGVAELAVVQTRLEKAPIETIVEIAKHYGVFDQLRATLSGQSPTPASQLEHKITQLEQQLQQNKFDPSQVDQKVSEAIQIREINEQVSAISKDLPFFADVLDEIPHYIARIKQTRPDLGIQESLTAAYDMAANADPIVRQKMRDLEARKATTSAADTKRTEAAKKAAAINVKPTSTGKGRELTEDEALAAAFDRATAA